MDETLPESPLPTQTREEIDYNLFHQELLHKPGLKRIPAATWTYPYNVEQTRMNTDPFVRKSMRLWDHEQYKSLQGFTKRARLYNGLEAFKNYSHPQRPKSHLHADDKMHAAYQRALKDATRVFTPHEKLYRDSVPDVCDKMNLDSAAGYSFPGKKKSECIEEVFDVASYMAHFIAAGKRIFIPPAKIALRGHLSAEDEIKTRPVWVFPAEVTVLEGKWALPYYRFLEREVESVHFGEGAMQRLAQLLTSDIASHSEATEVTLDWSLFDSSVTNWLIDDAFDIMFNSFDETAVRHQGDLVVGGDHMAQKNFKIKNWLKTYFKKTKVMLPDGSVYAKSHGIPSGSFFTQIIGSIVNYIVVRTLDYFNGWGGRRFRVLGDDSSFLVPNGKGKVDGQKVSDQAWTFFGLTLKKEKLRIASKQSQRKFLGYEIQGYRYLRSTADWLSMVLYPERDVEFLEQSCSRVFAFYLLGGCNDAVYCEFFHDYLNRYPAVWGKTLPVTSGIRRLFRFVFRYDIDRLQFPDLRNLDLLSVPFSLSLGDRPFG
jgi:hypothetical protein